MNSIITKNYTIYFKETAYAKLNSYLEDNKFSRIIVLTDTNTSLHCFEILRSKLSNLNTDEITNITFPHGENNKNISTCEFIWDQLSKLRADRNSLIINLGGGVVSDLGGFVASTYMRGLKFVNIPTTLLSIVDASIGGKNGVNLNKLKNQIGIINNPSMIVVDPIFLKTISQKEIKSGFSEMIKHALISGLSYWNSIKSIEHKNLYSENIFYNSILIKTKIVDEDPYEKNIRKILNYGHTIGHAIESFCLTSNNHEELTHGHSIAIGMILEGYISTVKLNFDKNQNNTINNLILHNFKKINFSSNDIEEIIKLIRFDKKNKNGELNFVLLKEIGKPVIDQKVDIGLIRKSFLYLNDIKPVH